MPGVPPNASERRVMRERPRHERDKAELIRRMHLVEAGTHSLRTLQGEEVPYRSHLHDVVRAADPFTASSILQGQLRDYAVSYNPVNNTIKTRVLFIPHVVPSTGH